MPAKALILTAWEWTIAVLRFFNLLEPNRRILSISKTLQWLSVIGTTYIMLYLPEYLVEALGLLGASTANYAYRRYDQTVRQERHLDGWDDGPRPGDSA